jgi:hypothetical protein
MCILQSKSIDRDPLWPQTRGRNDKLKPFHPQCLWMLMKHKIQIRPKKSLLFHHFFGGFIPAGPEARSLVGTKGSGIGELGPAATWQRASFVCNTWRQSARALSSRAVRFPGLLSCGPASGDVLRGWIIVIMEVHKITLLFWYAENVCRFLIRRYLVVQTFRKCSICLSKHCCCMHRHQRAATEFQNTIWPTD